VDILQVIVLALVQGLTEFLPISSSAHLILPSQLLGWPDQGLAFDVAVHVGTLTAVVVYFRKDIRDIAVGWFTQFGPRGATEQSQLGWAIIVATIPVCIVGFFGKDLIEAHLRSSLVIAVTTIIFGLLLWWADARCTQKKVITELTMKLALVIGLFQVLALIPGTSRSGITITAALILGFSRTHAARFSFLISIPTILLGGAFSMWELIQAQFVDWFSIAVGFVVSGISAYLCIVYFLNVISRMGMLPFVVYRLMLGCVLLAVLWL